MIIIQIMVSFWLFSHPLSLTLYLTRLKESCVLHSSEHLEGIMSILITLPFPGQSRHTESP